MPKPFTPSCCRNACGGFSLLELLVSTAVASLIAAAVFTLAATSRSLYESDEARVRVQQNLLSGREIVLSDVLTAGERLTRDFPAIEIVDGGGGVADQLILRRNVGAVVLPVCELVDGSDTSFKIAETVSPPAGCSPVSDTDADGWPDNLQVWRDFRLAAGGTAMAYIFDPIARVGEFFEYVAEDAALRDITAVSGTSWTYTYPTANMCRVYLLEERRYELAGDLLRVIVNEDTSAPINILDDIQNFQSVAVFQDGTQQNSLSAGDPWGDLGAIQIRLESRLPVRNRFVGDSWLFEALPRNVLSR